MEYGRSTKFRRYMEEAGALRKVGIILPDIMAVHTTRYRFFLFTDGYVFNVKRLSRYG